MADLGTVYTDKQIAKVEKRINTVYSEPARDIEKKMNGFTERHKVKAAKYAQQVADGKITQAQYDAWMRGQVFQGKQWQAKRDQILGVIHDSNGVAARMVSGSTYGVFSFNSNYMAYRIEQKAGVNFGFGLYDTATVTRMIKGEPQLLPKYNLNKAKDYIWNEKKLNNAVTQGIIQGESLDDISERIAESLSTQNNNTMKTFARTAMTGAQNAGRLMRMHEAKSLGINVKKQWMATLDGHTRDTHADIDGEVQELDNHGRELPFSNGCLFPGDPNGAPAEVYNCRCTLDEIFEDYPSEYKRYDNIDGKPIKNMTYREWERAKKGTKPATPSAPSPFAVAAARKATISRIMASESVRQMTPEQAREFEQLLDFMSDEHLELYEGMTALHSDNIYTSGSGFYSPSSKRVEMKLSAVGWEKSVGRSSAKGAWKTKFHEELHQLDHVLGQMTVGGERWQKLTACENVGWFGGNATEVGVRLGDAICSDIIDVINRAIDEHNAGLLTGKPLKHITDLSKPIPKDVKTAFFSYLGRETGKGSEGVKQRALLSAFTDAVGLATKGRINPYSEGYWGHPLSYQKERGLSGATSECFAEIGSHIMRGDEEALTALRKFMPRSVDEFGKVISEQAKYVKNNPLHY